MRFAPREDCLMRMIGRALLPVFLFIASFAPVLAQKAYTNDE
jgi:hypothetical protein